MAIDFPGSPTNGQTFTSGSVTYTWDGTKWTAVASGGGATNLDGLSDVTITTPSSSQVLSYNGSQWVNAAAAGGSVDIITEGNTSAEVIDTGSDGRFVVTTEGTEALRVDSSRRLLVGTSSVLENASSDARVQILGGTNVLPGLRIQATNSNNAGCLQLGNDPTGSGITCGIRITGDTGGVTTYNTYRSSGGDPGHTFAVNSTDRMRVGSLGTVYSLAADDACRFSTTWGAGQSYAFIRGRHSGSSLGGGTESFIVYSNGNVQNTNNSYGAISDVKLKENIVDAGSQWDDVKALQVRKYNFKEGQTHTQIGLVAQEVELVSPGLVNESPDRDEDGNDLGTVTKSVNYSVLYMKAVKALQEAMERIETLEAKVAALETP